MKMKMKSESISLSSHSLSKFFLNVCLMEYDGRRMLNSVANSFQIGFVSKFYHKYFLIVV